MGKLPLGWMAPGLDSVVGNLGGRAVVWMVQEAPIGAKGLLQLSPGNSSKRGPSLCEPNDPLLSVGRGPGGTSNAFLWWPDFSLHSVWRADLQSVGFGLGSSALVSLLVPSLLSA